MGSVCIALPAPLGHAGDVALGGRLAQADPAEAELAVVSARATATAATVVFPALILGFTALTDLLGSLGHASLTLLGGAVATLGGVLVRAVLGLGTRVRLGVLLFQFVAGGLLRFGFQARLLVFPLFLSGFFGSFPLGLAGST